jgi:hypothetical protein
VLLLVLLLVAGFAVNPTASARERPPSRKPAPRRPPKGRRAPQPAPGVVFGLSRQEVLLVVGSLFVAVLAGRPPAAGSPN